MPDALLLHAQSQSRLLLRRRARDPLGTEAGAARLPGNNGQLRLGAGKGAPAGDPTLRSRSTKEEISALLVHDQAEPLDTLELALRDQSIKTCRAYSCQGASLELA